MSSQPDNCVLMTAVRLGDRVTITVVSLKGRPKRSITVDADGLAYSMFLDIADHVTWGSGLPEVSA